MADQNGDHGQRDQNQKPGSESGQGEQQDPDRSGASRQGDRPDDTTRQGNTGQSDRGGGQPSIDRHR